MNRFENYNPPPTTDGSYVGTMNHSKQTQKYLEDKFTKNLEQVKKALKDRKIKVGLVVAQGTIQLQASLPLKPNEESSKMNAKKQYKISLGIPANLDGLKTAEEEAYELGKLIARKQFEWNDKYLGKNLNNKESKIVLAQIIDEFEKKYFQTHKLTVKSEHTFHTYKRIITKHIPNNFDLRKGNYIELFEKIDSEAIREKLKQCLHVLSRCFDLDIDLKNIRTSRKPTQDRKIPSDYDIEQGYFLFHKRGQEIRKFKDGRHEDYLFWQWVYGMLATYGLRPHELFKHPNIEWWLSPENTNNTWKVNDITKTGYREVLPLPSSWINTFELKNKKNVEILKVKSKEIEDYKSTKKIVSYVSRWMNKINLDFKPYDLRHAWAIRAHLLGIPIKAAADNLGHTVQIHTETYQRWFSLDNRKRAINEALNKKDEVEMLQLENSQLKEEIEKLKIEITKLKLIQNMQI